PPSHITSQCWLAARQRRPSYISTTRPTPLRRGAYFHGRASAVKFFNVPYASHKRPGSLRSPSNFRPSNPLYFYSELCGDPSGTGYFSDSSHGHAKKSVRGKVACPL